MKIIRPLHLCLALVIASSAAMSPASVAQAEPAPSTPAKTAPLILSRPVDSPAKTLRSLRIRGGDLMGGVNELTTALEAANLPEMNVIFAPEARQAQVPDMLLRNVSGPDALRLLTASAGCDLEPIMALEPTPGVEGQIIGYRVFHPQPGELGGFGGGRPAAGIPPAVEATEAAPIGGAPAPGFTAFPGGPNPSGQFTSGTRGGQPGSISQMGSPGILGYGAMMSPNASNVRVYSLGGITNTTKFSEVEATLRDVLKADGIAADTAKIAFHERTNVLVVNADARVHDLVTQFLDALQKNVTAAFEEQKRSYGHREKVTEELASIRVRAEQEQRERVMKQLEDTEQLYREAQRELDRIKTGAPKAQ